MYGFQYFGFGVCRIYGICGLGCALFLLVREGGSFTGLWVHGLVDLNENTGSLENEHTERRYGSFRK